MIFRGTGLSGAYLIEPEPQRDERGLFARTWSLEAFAERGLATSFSQCATSFNLAAGTLRGLHFQAHPQPEAKLVRCTRGRIFDVIVDLRPGSPTLYAWFVALITPAVAVPTYFLVGEPSEPTLGLILGLVSGSFLYIGATDILPEIKRSSGWRVSLAVAAGALIPLLLRVL